MSRMSRTSETSTPGHSRRLSKAHRLSLAGAATLGAAALAFSLAPAGAGAGSGDSAALATAAPAAWTQVVDGAQATGLRQHLVVQEAAAAKRAEAPKWAAKHHRSPGRAPVYANDLSGWIKESLAIMKEHGIPGTYGGLYKNIMRESSGNPSATNGWDVNARNGDPSIGLLQVIRPTFLAYHVPGTADSQYDPVANIVAAAHYAAARYGSIDNVDSAY
ncbi:transglycosylase SLT domain-containing protein [Streptomyces sp. NPDC056773]|uniref:transglycosylase SLT domain-containing protein n=1 Tax=unclassified Streptomyces TaxID=2593676 RepID=UPI0036943902